MHGRQKTSYSSQLLLGGTTIYPPALIKRHNIILGCLTDCEGYWILVLGGIWHHLNQDPINLLDLDLNVKRKQTRRILYVRVLSPLNCDDSIVVNETGFTTTLYSHRWPSCTLPEKGDIRTFTLQLHVCKEYVLHWTPIQRKGITHYTVAII